MRKLLVLSAVLILAATLVSDRLPARVSTGVPPSGLTSYATGQPAEAEGPSSYPSEWDWIRRAAPYWQVDETAFAKAFEVARALREEAALSPSISLLSLTPAGPTNIGGRIADIEWDPTNVNVAYAAAATGGVLKSTNGGLSWTLIGDALPNVNAGDLAVDPSAPQTVWLGTGEPNGGHNNFPGRGVYRSTNGGTDWSFMGLESSASIGRIVVDPSNSNRVFVAAQGSYFGPTPVRGLYRTIDGGTSWQLVLSVSDSTGATDVVIDPTNPSRLLAATWERVRRPNGGTHLFGPTSGIWRSLNGGNTWTKLGLVNGLPDPATQNIGRIGLALCPANPNVAYAVITNGNNVIGLWRTLDFGTSWVNRDADLEIQAGGGGFSWYFTQVRVAPNNCDRVYPLDVTYFRSEDGGLTFPIQYGYGGGPADFHVDHHALAFQPGNPAVLLEGNDGGISRSTDAGTNFTKIAPLPLTQFYEIGLDLTNPDRLYGGTQDNNTVRTMTGGLSDWQAIYGGDGFYVNVHPVNPDTIYAEAQFGDMGRSSNGGASFVAATPPGAGSDRKNWSTPVKLDPVTPNVVYYGTQRLWRSPNGGVSWTAVSGDLTGWVPGAVLGTITTIAISPADHHVVWLGTDDGRVWRGVEAGGVFAWTNVTSAPLPPRWVTRVVPHPTDPTRAWVTFSGLKWQDPESHVFSTINSGANWTSIASNLPDVPINGMAVDPANPQLLFVGTDLGAYYSDNGGGLWNYLSPDLPLVPVYDLAIHPTARYLAIGTHGRSMYKLQLSSLLAVGPRTAAPATLLQNSPNPFSARTSIGFTLTRPGRVHLGVYDVAGRRIRVLLAEERGAGRHDVTWDGRDDAGRAVRAGSYRYRLELADGKSLSRGIVRVQ